MATQEDFGIPITQKSVFAVNLDIKKKTENIIIGEDHDIRRYMNGLPHGDFLFSVERGVGSLIMDYEPLIIGNVIANLVGSIGKRKSPYFTQAVEALVSYYRSENPIYRFTALLMWQEYNRALTDRKAAENLYDTLDDVTLALRFHMIDCVKEWQEVDRKNPLRFLETDFRKFPVELHFASDKNASAYAVTNISPLAIAVYYLKRIYESGRYIQTCPMCGRAFVAKTAGMATLCSDACRRIQGRESKRRFDERAKNVTYERASKNAYMYWYNKMVKLRRMDLPKTKLDKAEQLFKSYTDEATQRKKDVAKKITDAAGFEAWLLEQRDVIDGFMDEVTIK